MNDFFNSFMDRIDITVVVIVLCAGFFQSRYIKFRISKDDSYDGAIKTLLLSFLASMIYIMLMRNPANPTNWAKYFISYFAATSLYELLISKFVDWIKTKTGVDIKGG